LEQAHTEMIAEFVFRDHVFDTTTTYSFRLSRRTLLPAVKDVIVDSRMYYHRCRLAKPPNKHLPLGVLMLNKAKWLKLYVMGQLPSKNAGVDSDDEESEDDVDEDALSEVELKVNA